MGELNLIDHSCVLTSPPHPWHRCGCVCESEFRRRTEKSYGVGRNFLRAHRGRTHWVDASQVMFS